MRLLPRQGLLYFDASGKGPAMMVCANPAAVGKETLSLPFGQPFNDPCLAGVRQLCDRPARNWSAKG
jgi:hypothetical protein